MRPDRGDAEVGHEVTRGVGVLIHIAIEISGGILAQPAANQTLTAGVIRDEMTHIVHLGN